MSKTGIIYKLVSTDINIKECYVGSTINFIRRKHEHKRRCNNENSDNYNQYVYKFIRDNNGWDSFSMIQIEEFKFNTRNELNSRERYWIETLQAKLNKILPTRTRHEYREQNKDKIKEYRENNKDKLKEYYENNKDKSKEYYENNKDKIKEYYKEYYKNNKDKSKEYSKEYYENNKETLKVKDKEYRENNKDKSKEYYENNKDKIKEYYKEYYENNKDKSKEYYKEYYENNKETLKEKTKENYQKRTNLKFYTEFLEYLYSW